MQNRKLHDPKDMENQRRSQKRVGWKREGGEGGGVRGGLGRSWKLGRRLREMGGSRRRRECREGSVTGGVVGVLIDPNRLSGGRRYYYIVSSYYYGCVLILFV